MVKIKGVKNFDSNAEIVDKLIKAFKPIWNMHQKKINELEKRIFKINQKFETIKTGLIYKTKEGYICPVCNTKLMED